MRVGALEEVRVGDEVRVSAMEGNASVCLDMLLGVEVLAGGPPTALPLDPPYWRLRRAILKWSSARNHHTLSHALPSFDKESPSIVVEVDGDDYQLYE